MRFSNSVTGEQALVLTKAILVYSNSSGDAFCSYNKVNNINDKLTIGEGRAVTEVDVEELVGLLHGKGSKGQFLDGNQLYNSATTKIWYVPSATQKMYILDKAKQTELSGIAKQPNLIMAVSKNQLYVFAIKDKGRPTPETQLFYAPYWNVWDSGKVCLGNIKAPSDKFNLTKWIEVFFNSYFTHSNNPKTIKHKLGWVDFWREMISSQKEFSNSVLCDANMTLANFIKIL